jgi:hypothetical protein
VGEGRVSFRDVDVARVVRPGGLVAAYMWDFDGGVPLQPFTMVRTARA